MALDGEGRNSPYTGPLVKRIVLEGQDILELLRQVRKDVLTATGNKQIPWDTNALTEKFYFNMTIEIGPAPAPTTIQPEAGGVQAEWAIVKDTNSAEVLKAFKEKYKDQDLYVALADERLAMLIQKSPPNVTPPAAATPILAHLSPEA